jgi:hypothetical protein
MAAPWLRVSTRCLPFAGSLCVEPLCCAALRGSAANTAGRQLCAGVQLRWQLWLMGTAANPVGNVACSLCGSRYSLPSAAARRCTHCRPLQCDAASTAGRAATHWGQLRWVLTLCAAQPDPAGMAALCASMHCPGQVAHVLMQLHPSYIASLCWPSRGAVSCGRSLMSCSQRVPCPTVDAVTKLTAQRWSKAVREGTACQQHLTGLHTG